MQTEFTSHQHQCDVMCDACGTLSVPGFYRVADPSHALCAKYPTDRPTFPGLECGECGTDRPTQRPGTFTFTFTSKVCVAVAHFASINKLVYDATSGLYKRPPPA